MKLYETKKLCLKKKIKYFELKQKNVSKIKTIVKKYKVSLGVIAGARILDKKVIEFFLHF